MPVFSYETEKCKAHVIKARLDNGDVVVIDNAHETKDITYTHMYKYLGRGVYYSQDGRVSEGTKKYHFWRNK